MHLSSSLEVSKTHPYGDSTSPARVFVYDFLASHRIITIYATYTINGLHADPLVIVVLKVDQLLL